MAQFKFRMPATSSRFGHQRHGPPRRPRAPPCGEPVSEEVPGPGWYESSFDLSRGLDVREGLPGDAQLHEWIEDCLRSSA